MKVISVCDVNIVSDYISINFRKKQVPLSLWQLKFKYFILLRIQNSFVKTLKKFFLYMTLINTVFLSSLDFNIKM